MPFILAGSSLRVGLVAGDSILITADSPANVTFVIGGAAIAGINKPGMDSRSLYYGPLLSAAEVIIAAVVSTDYEVVRGLYAQVETGIVVTLTAAEIAAPQPGVLSDTSATYKLSTAPFTRYRSDGTALVALGTGSGVTNLSFTRDVDSVQVNSDTGTDADLLAFTASQAGVVPASGGGTINFLRADGTFQVPPGGVTDGDKGDVIVSAAGTVWTADTNIARVITPFAEVGTAFNITNATHARDGTATNAAAITATFDFAGMTANQTTGQVQQLGAGVVTLAATAVGGGTVVYSYAPGVTASPTTAGVGGYICWRWLGGLNVLIEFRSQAAAGAGDFNRVVNDLTNYLAPDDTLDNLIQTYAIGALAAGDSLKIRVLIESAANAAVQSANVFVRLNNTSLGSRNDGGGSFASAFTTRMPMDVDIYSVTTAWSNFGQKDGDFAGVTFDGAMVTVPTMVTATNLQLHVQKSAAGRAFRVRGVFVDVVKA